MKHIITILLILGLLFTNITVMAEDVSVLSEAEYELANSWFNQIADIQPYDGKGQTISGNRFIIAVREPGYGVYTSLPGDGLTLDLSSFPTEHLATTFSEADTFIMIYPVYKVVGQYMGTGFPVSAQKTYTTVCAVDMISGTMRTPFWTVVKDPPKSVQIQTQNNIPMKNAFSGSYEPQEAIENVVRLLDFVDIEAKPANHQLPPAELVGAWSGIGIPKNGGIRIDLTAVIREDGTGEYTFVQGDYTENYPLAISAADNTFTVDIPIGKVEGTWALLDDKLMLDITTTFPNGRTYSYTAECNRSKDTDDSIKAGDTLFFGSYPQSGKDTMEPIEWLILETDGSKALLLSLYGLDGGTYDGYNYNAVITWENSQIRSKLNSTFLEKAFTSEQQEAILLTKVNNSKAQGYQEWDVDGGEDTEDWIFLLSYAEANRYLGVECSPKYNDAGTVQPTEYAKAQGCGYIWKNTTARGGKKKEYGSWLLRSPGNIQERASYVGTGGQFSFCTASESALIRPAMWVDLSKVPQLKEK